MTKKNIGLGEGIKTGTSETKGIIKKTDYFTPRSMRRARSGIKPLSSYINFVVR